MSEQTNTSEPQPSDTSDMVWMSGQDWLNNEQPAEGKLFVELRWLSSDEIFHSQEFDGITIAEAGERAVAFYLMEKAKGLPDRVPVATVYWADGRVFEPFELEISINIDAVGLRGGE